ncbi:MAG: hypothetical protein CVV51_00225 [Spirochaetae bacterium HGW-Spirochaetae-7]|jgi:rhodanese-related sulfurtransferase|nr:MAG: hypothetical protein CVV51_00225 [Spirochaetae bacterium HGW-Spirochaetae-7]
MKPTKLSIVAIAICLLAIAALAMPADEPVRKNGYFNIDAAYLARLLAAKDSKSGAAGNFFLVNTHVPYEGHIQGTDAFIPYNRTWEMAGRYPADKTARIVVYCMTGPMSDSASRALVRLGYTNVYNLIGGMQAWKRAGHALDYSGVVKP